jgi:Zn-dependent metalloprotease
MTALLGVVVLSMGWFAAGAPGFPAGATIRRDEARGTVRWAEATDLSAGLDGDAAVQRARAAGNPGDFVLAVLEARREALGLVAPRQELAIARIERDAGGMTRVRLAQRYRDIPVEGTELSAHVDAGFRLQVVSGRYVRTPAGVDPEPKLTPEAAVTAAARAAGVATDRVRRVMPLLVWYPDDQGRVRLAFRVPIEADLIHREQVFVDARTGEIAARIPTSMPVGSGSGGVIGP